MTYREYLIKTENRKSVSWSMNLMGFFIMGQQVLMVALAIIFQLALVFALKTAGKGDSIIDANKALSNTGNTLGLLFQFVIYIPALLLPALFYLLGRKRPLREVISFKRPKLSQLLIAYFGTMSFALVGSLLTLLITYLLDLMGVKLPDLPINAPTGLGTSIFFFIIIAVLPALLEEFAYRGVLMGELRRYNRLAAVLVSGIFFGLMHATVQQIPYAMFVGFAIAYFVIRFDSIWIGVFIHFVNNGLAAVVQFLFTLYPGKEKIIETGFSGLQILLFVIGLAILIPYFSLKGIELPKKKGELSFGLAMKGIFCAPVFYIAVFALLVLTTLTVMVATFVK